MSQVPGLDVFDVIQGRGEGSTERCGDVSVMLIVAQEDPRLMVWQQRREIGFMPRETRARLREAADLLAEARLKAQRGLIVVEREVEGREWCEQDERGCASEAPRSDGCGQAPERMPDQRGRRTMALDQLLDGGHEMPEVAPPSRGGAVAGGIEPGHPKANVDQAVPKGHEL